MAAVDPRWRVAVIGAGFAGLGMAIGLKRAGIDAFVVFESATALGGTWRDNTYPGCACDVPSHLYSYSFALKPDWTRVYSPWHEIRAYLEQCADRYDVRRHIRFDTRIATATFDEAKAGWTLIATDGRRFSADVVVSATGPLSKPAIPDLPGLAQFRGRMFHSARWDHDYVLDGRRVAVVGTGASAIQFVPRIAPRVERLYLFQRTPPWVVPRFDRAYTALERRLHARLPTLCRLHRTFIYWQYEMNGLAIIGYPPFNRLLEALARLHLRRQVADPALRARLTPDYRIGCKRVLVANDYYPALTRPNVELVSGAIERVHANGVVGTDGVEREVDAIVLATGFVATEFLAPMRIYGRGACELTERWQAGAETYLGMAVAGFPNFFMLVGPNTGLGHNSIVFMIESQVRYILQAIRAIGSGRADSVDVRPERQRAFQQRIQRDLRSTSWQSGCRSWYLDEDGRNFTLWPGFTLSYWLRTRRWDAADYLLTRRAPADPGSA
ncbi:MAG: NAD(P)/FAD-dependent oxidoreductase [Gammaproteobacteria bacterium]|nr:NAD(P)/FAD-dependent oxidoreductase [Gammaproteobacteria bacterium]